MNIHIPAQRPAPVQVAANAAPAPDAAEPGWGRVLRIAGARAVLALVASLVLWSLLPAVLGWTPRVILSGSMEPRIHVGDVVVTRDVNAANLVKGQVITVADPDHPGKTRTHRVVRLEDNGTLTLKGDANQRADSSRVSLDAVQGVGVLRVAFIGRPVYWVAEGNWLALGVTAGLLGLCVICAFPGQRKHEDASDDEDTRDEDNTTGTRPSRRVVGVRRVRSRRVAAALAVSVIVVGAAGGPADAAFKKVVSNPTSTLAAATNFYPYRTAVLADSPYLFWRLNETTGTAIDDAGTGGRDGTLLAQTYTMGQAGALSSEPNSKSLGLTIGVINANVAAAAGGPGSENYSVEAWVKSTSTTGGRILGLGNGTGQTASTTTDRQLYLAPDGKVMFGAVSGPAKTALASSAAVNNGAWHYVVGTSTGGPNGMKLYVDGVLQAQGNGGGPLGPGTFYWRAGAETLTGWPSAPTDGYYDGNLDELAVYSTTLSAARVLAHYNAGITP
jgi:signal peptidase I